MALVPISSGHISYHTVDTTVVQPGDVAEYSCDTLYKLEGDSIRICLRNGTWSGHEPTCVGKRIMFQCCVITEWEREWSW